MDTLALKHIAAELRKQLETYKEKEPAARALYAEMENLISAAERGDIHTEIEARDIPGQRIMDESNLREYRELSTAYSNFYVELIDGRGSDTLKMIEEIMRKVRS
jgi:predicted  nucleic acid-binding Zn-ribbon protein